MVSKFNYVHIKQVIDSECLFGLTDPSIKFYTAVLFSFRNVVVIRERKDEKKNHQWIEGNEAFICDTLDWIMNKTLINSLWECFDFKTNK